MTTTRSGSCGSASQGRTTDRPGSRCCARARTAATTSSARRACSAGRLRRPARRARPGRDWRRSAAASERAAAVVPYAVPAGSRGAQRWSLGVASLTRQLSHVKAWADCVHVPRIAPVLAEIMGPNYVCTGMGGELTAPGAVDYQELHSDLGDGDVVYDGVRMKNWDAPSAPAVVVNFAVCDLHGLNADPTAQVTAAVAGFSTQTRRCPGDADPRRDEFRLSTRSSSRGAACPPAPSSSATPARVARGHGERHGRRAPAAAERGARRPGTRAGARRRCRRRVRAGSLDEEGGASAGAPSPPPTGWDCRLAASLAASSRWSATATRSASTASAPAAVAVLALSDPASSASACACEIATKNADAGDPVYLPAPATITALEVLEPGGHGRRRRPTSSSASTPPAPR